MEQKETILFFDGSFDGLLTCIFTSYEEKLEVTAIYSEENLQPDFFAVTQQVSTDLEKSNRIQTALLKKATPAGFRQLIYAFLSEKEGIELLIFKYAKRALGSDFFSNKDYGDPVILKISQIAKMVGREKHRMEAFVRFKLTKDNIFFAVISPDFNVLPLILNHFETRYADQKWIIYDSGRNYGLFYDLKVIKYINLENYDNHKNPGFNQNIFDDSEIEFEDLWQNYYNSVNISSRKNTSLHIQHVPRRYWKYLSEKRTLHK